MPARKVIFELEGGPAALAKIAAALVAELDKAPFRLWLIGDLGAGKTTVVGAVLHALGLSEKVPVTSPTFTLVNEYEIGGSWYAHLDLYRVEAGFSAEELGLGYGREYRGLFIEWPERASEEPAFEPTHRLEISFTTDGQGRVYRLFRMS